MWKELIQGLTEHTQFGPPAGAEAISHVRDALGVALPSDLAHLLVESDGVEDEYGAGLIWPVQRIEADNLAFRRNAEFADLYMPFEHLLFFADAGNGDQFAFAIQNGQIRRPDVFVWNHEDDSRTWAAASLPQYLEWSLTGKLET